MPKGLSPVMLVRTLMKSSIKCSGQWSGLPAASGISPKLFWYLSSDINQAIIMTWFIMPWGAHTNKCKQSKLCESFSGTRTLYLQRLAGADPSKPIRLSGSYHGVRPCLTVRSNSSYLWLGCIAGLPVPAQVRIALSNINSSNFTFTVYISYMDWRLPKQE